MIDTLKRCTKCGLEKSVEEFGKSGYTKKDGTQSPHPWCKTCCLVAGKKYKYRHKKYYEKNSEKCRAYTRDRYAENPEKHIEITREWRRKNSSKMRGYHKKWHENRDRFIVALATSKKNARREGYEPCNATYREIVSAYTGFCAVCGVPELECKVKLRMDHCHISGDFRGWLCHKCNSVLGFVKDDVTILDGMIKYLDNQKQKQETKDII